MEPNGNRDLKAVAVLVRLKNERPDVHKAAYVAVGRMRPCRDRETYARCGGVRDDDWRCADCNAAEIRRELRRLARNAVARDRNAVLREVCGTSAAAARRDMGM